MRRTLIRTFWYTHCIPMHKGYYLITSREAPTKRILQILYWDGKNWLKKEGNIFYQVANKYVIAWNDIREYGHEGNFGYDLSNIAKEA